MTSNDPEVDMTSKDPGACMISIDHKQVVMTSNDHKEAVMITSNDHKVISI